MDLEALVGRGGPPGYDHFWDYCHYTPAGSVLVGQALAAGVLDALGEPPPPVTPSQAHAAFFARWRGRTVDPFRLEHWTGVDFNGVGIFLWADGAEPNSEGDPAAAAVYRGNRHASSASPTSLEPARLARAAWADARVLDPTLGVVLDANERLLRWRVGEGPIDPRTLPDLPPR